MYKACNMKANYNINCTKLYYAKEKMLRSCTEDIGTVDPAVLRTKKDLCGAAEALSLTKLARLLIIRQSCASIESSY